MIKSPKKKKSVAKKASDIGVICLIGWVLLFLWLTEKCRYRK